MTPDSFLSLYLNALTALFVIIDPIGAALIFHSLLPAEERQHRLVMAIKSVLISGTLLIVFGLYGEALFHQLGININALRISGGFLLFFTAFRMITGEIRFTVHTSKEDISVYPMSIPLLAGPGSLTLAILLFSRAANTEGQLAITAAIASTLLLTFVLMLAARYLKRVIGKTGDEILRRFLGVILAALAVQFVYDGVHNLWLMA
ncbi:MAG: hypothetical protein CME36_03095 [unclassified Hahellaceae]|nr:hypothetical protein [Hahellaceae bacterium]